MRKKSVGNILIDLTSLLDVIFIVLLVVICRLQTMDESAAKKEGMEQTMMNEAQSSQKLYKDQMESISAVSEYVVLISINAHYDSDVITRHIEVLDSSVDTQMHEIAQLKGTNVEEGLNALRTYLQDAVKNNPEKTMIISLNEGDEDILYRDENSINKIIDEMVASDPEHVKRRN